jgi:transposase-like protein
MAEEDILDWAQNKLSKKYATVEATIISRSFVALITEMDEEDQSNLLLAIVKSQYNSNPNNRFFRLLLKYSKPNLDIISNFHDKGILIDDESIMKVLSAWSGNSKEKFEDFLKETVERDIFSRKSDIKAVSY